MKNRILLTLSVIFAALQVQAQTQGIAFSHVGKGVATPFVTDYQSLGVNVSALGWGTGYENKRFTAGSSEFAFSIYSDSLNVTKLRNLYKAVRTSVMNKDPQDLNYQQQREAAAEYAQAGIAMNLDYNWAGFSFQTPKFGGIAFNIRENYQYYSKFNQQTTDLIFRGKLSSLFDSLTVVFGSDTSRIENNDNISQDTLAAVIQGTIGVPISLSSITNGSEMRMVWNRTYELGYGRKIFGKDSIFVVYGGIGGRIISSMAMFNMTSDDAGLVMYSSITPAFNIDYASISGTNQMKYDGGIPPAVGQGYGVDLAASVIILNKIKVAAAVNNIGSVKYTQNVYKVRDTLFGSFSLAGLSDVDITQSINQLLTNGGILTLEGQREYTLKNASTFRFGASFEPASFLKLGFDMVAPFDSDNPGSIQNAVFSFGGEVRPVKWIALNAGYFGGGIYKSNIPVGVTFILKEGAYECGIASRDALSFFFENSNSVSTAFGFARFRF
jgi:hypothetical protein